MTDEQLEFNLGDISISATYDEWEELFIQLEQVFGCDAIEFLDPENEDDMDILAEFENMFLEIDPNSDN